MESLCPEGLPPPWFSVARPLHVLDIYYISAVYICMYMCIYHVAHVAYVTYMVNTTIHVHLDYNTYDIAS